MHYDFITLHIEKKLCVYICLYLLADNWWIGFTDIKTEGSFEWISGQPVTYTDWFQGPPPEPNGETWNNAQADCVMMRYSYGFQWTDDYCGFIDGHAICELW